MTFYIKKDAEKIMDDLGSLGAERRVIRNTHSTLMYILTQGPIFEFTFTTKISIKGSQLVGFCDKTSRRRYIC